MTAVASTVAFQRFAERALVDSNLELEIGIDGPITATMFNRLVTTLTEDTGHDPAEVVQLDVLQESTRLEYHGPDTIKRLLISDAPGMLPPSRALMKRREMAPVSSEQFDYTVRLKREVDVTSDASCQTRIDIDAFRLKRRFSFALDICQVDCTIVQEKTKHSKSPTAFKFEVEVELRRGDNMSGTDAERIVEVMHTTAVRCLCVMQGTVSPVSRQDRSTIAHHLFESLGVGDPGKIRIPVPHPVTLEPVHLDSLWNDYTVTDKADGLRCQLITVGHRAYTLDSLNVLRLAAVDVPSSANDAILDGELITRNKAGHDVNTFAAFDVYRARGDSVCHMPLYGTTSSPTRCDILARFMRDFQRAEKMDGFLALAKNFQSASSDSVRNALDRLETSEYHTDGLIFTPAALAVGARFDGDASNMDGTWAKTFKWKPPECNTIDFLVLADPAFSSDVQAVTVPAPDGLGAGMCRVFQVYASYVPRRWERLDVSKFIQFGDRAFPGSAPESRKFDLAGTPEGSRIYVPTDATGMPVCKNGSPVSENTIVECAYVKPDSEAGRWEATRVRADKTEKLRRNGIAGAANDWGTASNVWRSILCPVTRDMLTCTSGTDTPECGKAPKEEYYALRNFERKRSMLYNMANFHNTVVKAWLYTEAAKSCASAGTPALFELACGKGGDLPRWSANGFNPIVGVDKSMDNIVNAMDGIYARLSTCNAETRGRTMVFVCMDAATRMRPPLDEVRLASADSPHGDIIAALWDTSSRPMTNTAMSPFRGIVLKGFDVVSCQFALHYMFESDLVLDRFVRNIDYLLRPGGVMIATCFDGDRLAKELDSAPNGRLAGVTAGGVVAWSIEKAYQGKFDGGTGAAIDVFVETINQTIREYLVSPLILRARLQRIGVEQVSASPFAHWLPFANETLTTVEKQLSSKSTAFVFKRAMDRSPDHPPPSRAFGGAILHTDMCGDLE